MPAQKKTDADRLADANEIIRKKNAENVDQRRQIQQLQRDEDTAEKIRAEIWGLSEHDPAPPAWLTGKGIPHGGRGGPVLMVSDIHYGEVVRKDEVGGVNEFNAQIAARRIKALTDATVDITSNHMGRSNVPYPGIVVALLGDMISGNLHEELLATNDKTPHQSVNEVIDLLAAMIDTLATKFGRVFAPAVCGNHGRSTHKGRYKGLVYSNFDWNIYCGLARYFRKEKNIQFMIPNAADARFNVFGTRFLASHGDNFGVKGGDGIIGVLGPLARGRLKVGQSEAAIGRDFDVLLCGHYHQLVFLPNLICNGTVKGFCDFAHLALRAPYAPPSQALFFVHPKLGITARWPIFLEPPQKAIEKSAWTSWE
jgi:predicted phosphodiesterase